jgi:hypothetical protein
LAGTKRAPGPLVDRLQRVPAVAAWTPTRVNNSIIYDFEAPPEQDWTETVLTLASLSLFVIADITLPVSVPLELQATVPNCMMPFVPVQKKGHPSFSMFKNLQKKYDWVPPVILYSEEQDLVNAFDEVIRIPALEKRRRLLERKGENVADVDLDALGDSG